MSSDKPTIVLTNDDGYLAPGIRACYRILRDFGTVHVIAPKTEQSACSHKIAHRHPLLAEQLCDPELGELYAVSGTPADCIRLAVGSLMKEPIDLIVSGINQGANAGIDVFYSGTIAAAREGAIHGITSIAVSLALREGVEPDWPTAANALLELLPGLQQEKLPSAGFWSVNLPASIPADIKLHTVRTNPSIDAAPMHFERSQHDGQEVFEFSYRGDYWNRGADDDSDFAAVRRGDIAITAIPLLSKF